MSIVTGQTVLAADFINKSTRQATQTSDSGRVAKLESTGFLADSFLESFFGDGSDGNVVLDGTNTFAFLTKSGNDYTMTRDIFCNNLTINSGCTIAPQNYRIFVRGTISGAGKVISNGGNGGNGGNASASTGGTAGAAGTSIPDGYFLGRTAGAGAVGNKNSVSGLLGTAPNNAAPSIGSQGAGGANGGGFRGADPDAGAGNAPGTITAPYLTFRKDLWASIRGLDILQSGTLAKLLGSTGGGGGRSGASGNTTSAGGGSGGGGAPGGTIFIIARVWAGTFNIEAKGGNGGNGGNGFASGSGGGGGGAGGGGAGGVVAVFYGIKTWTGSYVLTAGTGGTGGTGATGGGDVGQAGSSASAGTAGVSYELAV